MKVAFVTDTGSGLSPEQWKKEGIYCVPLQIECDGISYDEMETISYAQFIENLHQKKIMRTSLPKLGHIEDCFQEIKDAGYDTVFCVPICKGLSGALDAMEMIAKQLDLAFVGIDCYVTAVVEQTCIRLAKKMIDEGKSIDAVKAALNQIIASADTILIFEDLQHMRRGGRLTPTAALLGGLLRIKPVLHIDQSTQGRVDVLDKPRTLSRAQASVIKRLKEMQVNKDYTFILAHVDALENAKAFKMKLEESIEGCKVQIIDLVSAVGVHTGLGCLALQVFNANYVE